MTKISQQAIEILNKIAIRGMVVLWSFGTPNPVYGQNYEDGERLTPLDWYICQTELWSIEEESHRQSVTSWIEVIQQESYGSYLTTKQYMRQPDGTLKYLADIETKTGNYQGQPDNPVILSREEINHDETNILKVRVWKSSWLERQYIEKDDDFEESVGLIERYILTDKARELIATKQI